MLQVFNALVKRWDKDINVDGGCLEIKAFSRFEYHMFYVLYPFVTYLLTLPCIYIASFSKNDSSSHYTVQNDKIIN
jgi:hypothetical protein